VQRPAVDPQKLAMYDQAFLGILQSEGKIELFLDAAFSFLYRKTDFFRLLTDKSTQNLGFPPGTAGKMVEHYFAKYMKLSLSAYEDMINRLKLKEQKEAEAKKAVQNGATITEINDEITPGTTEKAPKVEESSSSQNLVEPQKIQNNVDTKVTEKAPEKMTEKTLDVDTAETHLTYNGSKTDAYKWCQNYDDVDVTLDLPDVTSAKQIKVDIRQFPECALKVSASGKVIIDSKLKHAIIAEDSTWTFDKKQHQLCINLAKNAKAWWDAVLPDEKPIDIQKDVKAERSMEDLPEDERAVINKLQFDQHQKRLGKPTSDELKVHEQLKKGWNSEGSPFKGTDFDPSKFQISGS